MDHRFSFTLKGRNEAVGYTLYGHRIDWEALEQLFADSCRKRCVIGNRKACWHFEGSDPQLGQPWLQPTGQIGSFLVAAALFLLSNITGQLVLWDYN